MSHTACRHCDAAVDNGLLLCDLCQQKARTIFEYLPAYFHNLARWRPGRTGSRQVPGSRVLYDGPRDRAGTGDRISDALDEATSTLIQYAIELTKSRHFPRPLTYIDAVLTGGLPAALAEELADNPSKHVAALCAAFEQHLTSIATRDWCGRFLSDLNHHETKLGAFTETLVPGWYAGACRRCSSPTYVVPGLTWVTCRGCGSTTYARDHLEVVLDEARGWVAPPKRLAEAIVALVDTEMSVPRLHKRISKWGERWPDKGTCIEPIRRVDADGDPVGPKRYRLGDVIDVLLANGATRLDTPMKVPAS